VGNKIAFFVGYYYSKGNIGFVGVDGAFQIEMISGEGENAGLMSGYHIYSGYDVLKFGGTKILTNITTDTSSKSFYDNNSGNFISGPSRDNNGRITVSSKLNEYPSSWSAKSVYQLTIVTEDKFNK